MKRVPIILTALAILSPLLSGCPRSSSNEPTPNAGDEFTDARKEAVRMVVEQIVAANNVFATLSSLNDPRLDLDGIGFGRFGDCPFVSYVNSSTNTAAVSIDFGTAGCTAANTAKAVVSGELNVDIRSQTASSRARFDDITIDSRDIQGSISSATFESAIDGRAFRGSCQVRIEDVGELRVSDIIFVGLGESGEIILDAADSRVIRGTVSYNVELTQLIANPVVYENFVPESGTLTFRGPEFTEIVVEFSRRSAEQGVVRVVVGNASALNFQAVELD